MRKLSVLLSIAVLAFFVGIACSSFHASSRPADDRSFDVRLKTDHHRTVRVVFWCGGFRLASIRTAGRGQIVTETVPLRRCSGSGWLVFDASVDAVSGGYTSDKIPIEDGGCVEVTVEHRLASTLWMPCGVRR